MMMFIINRAGFKFTWVEMMQMPLSRLDRYYQIGKLYFEEKNKALK